MNLLSAIYGGASALRNKLYDRGVLKTRRLQRPVVSVGNLSVGGAGKTPFVIALGELLKARGVRFDVLSRGYGRKSRGVLMVGANGSASDYGDEPLLIARKLGVPVVVGESRYEAGRLAEQRFDSQLHILDDGFQHRSLARAFDIVMLTEHDFTDHLLPSGRLREPLEALKRADMVVVPDGFRFDDSQICNKPWITIHRSVVVSSAPVSPIAFCGIARPRQFFAHLRDAGLRPAEEICFRDHHAYTVADIGHLRAIRTEMGAGGFVTSEKDAVNLGSLESELAPLAIATLRLSIMNPADFLDVLLSKIGVQADSS